MELSSHSQPSSWNPFLNHLVIENIIKYIHRPSDLKPLRLICHNWAVTVTPKLMQISSVYINSEKKMRLYLEDFSDVNMGMKVDRRHLPLHRNFHLKVLQSLDSHESELFLSFILKSGVGAEELHLSKCVMTRKEILGILRLGSELRILSFNEVLVDDNSPICYQNKQKRDDEKEDIVVDVDEQWGSQLIRLEVTTCDEGDLFPWSDIFTRASRLQVLHAQLKSLQQVSSLLEAMLNHPLPLQEFSSFLVDFETSELNLLTALELPLKILDLSISSNVHNSTIQSLLLGKTGKTLENLKLFHETEGDLNSIVLPKLENLKSLELMGDPICSNIFENIYKSCRHLRHLNLSQVKLQNMDLLMKSSFSHDQLLSLSIEEGFLSFNILTKVSKWFPNIRKVCLFLNDENIGALFKEYENLEELIVLGTELTDLGMIGVSPTNGRRFIGDCKKLRKFSLYPQPQQRITDMSIYHGLVHVKELTSVELPETAITNEGLKSLKRAKPNLVRLSAKIAIHPRTGEHSLRSTKYQI